MAAPMDDAADGKDEAIVHPYASDIDDARVWMKQYIEKLRDCRYYEEEYRECRSYRGQFNSYYTYGEQVDCDHWKDVFEQCKLVKKDNDEEALDNVVAHELLRRDFRLKMARNNDVWEYRMTPPEDWKHIPPHPNDTGSPEAEEQSESENKEQSESEKISLTERAKQKAAQLQEDLLLSSKPKVNPKYDNTVQRCTIL